MANAKPSAAVVQHGFYARPSAHLPCLATRAGLGRITRSSNIARFVQGGVVKTFRWATQMTDYTAIARTPELAFENYQVLTLVAALNGAVRPNLRAVFLQCTAPDSVNVHFVLSADTPDDREEISDIIFELEAGQLDPLNVACNPSIYIHNDDIQLPSNLGRAVFIRNSPQFA